MELCTKIRYEMIRRRQKQFAISNKIDIVTNGNLKSKNKKNNSNIFAKSFRIRGDAASESGVTSIYFPILEFIRSVDFVVALFTHTLSHTAKIIR